MAAARTAPDSRDAVIVAGLDLDALIGQLTMVGPDPAGVTPIGPEPIAAQVRRGAAGSLLNITDPAEIRALQALARDRSPYGLPLLFALDVLHGHKTIFPIPLAEACAFDPRLWEATARAAAFEAAADGQQITFAPMLDVGRDPRWGRIAEGPGEDPYVASRFARARVLGFQGEASRPLIAATAKHMGGYGAVEGGRDYGLVDVSPQTLHEVHLAPFRAAIEAGVALVMPSFTDLAGLPPAADPGLLRGLLRARWGFEGVIVSDWLALAELPVHGLARDKGEAAALALNAGIDIDMMGGIYRDGLKTALERGLVAIERVREAVMRVIALKRRLGLLDRPSDETGTLQRTAPPPSVETRKLARRTAQASIVLLKNEDGLLPLGEAFRRLAIIGPLARDRRAMLGPWAAEGDPQSAVTFEEGLAARFGSRLIGHAEGVPVEEIVRDGIDEALALGNEADCIILTLGEHAFMSGEAASRADPGLPGLQRDLAQAVLSLSKPTVLVIGSGRPLIDTAIIEKAQAVLATWFLGHEAGHALASILSGDSSPAGRLAISWPRHVGQIPVFFSHRPTGRPTDDENPFTNRYRDLASGPLFPFGHGLSYTRFVLTGMEVERARVDVGEPVAVSVEVQNTGSRSGATVLFLFIRDPIASRTRPVLELKAFERIHLDAGASAVVRFVLERLELAFPLADGSLVMEEGEIRLLAGFRAVPDELTERTVTLA